MGQAVAAATARSSGRSARRYAGTSFQQALANTLGATVVNASARQTVHHSAAVHPAASRSWVAPDKSSPPLPSGTSGALTQAMAAEHVPDSWKSGLSFIVAQESGGKVDAHSPVHSARGLFQLTAANYQMNPHGAASFGNAVEEAQGGIRYIRARYGSADKAVAFWRTHKWY
jgi:hypothetical protein